MNGFDTWPSAYLLGLEKHPSVLSYNWEPFYFNDFFLRVPQGVNWTLKWWRPSTKMADLSNITSQQRTLTNYRAPQQKLAAIIKASYSQKPWAVWPFCYICMTNTVNYLCDGQWQCWHSHIQWSSWMLWVFIWQEKSLASTVEWLSAIGLINWSNSQKLDGWAQLLSLLKLGKQHLVAHTLISYVCYQQFVRYSRRKYKYNTNIKQGYTPFYFFFLQASKYLFGSPLQPSTC